MNRRDFAVIVGNHIEWHETLADAESAGWMWHQRASLHLNLVGAGHIPAVVRILHLEKIL